MRVAKRYLKAAWQRIRHNGGVGMSRGMATARPGTGCARQEQTHHSSPQPATPSRGAEAAGFIASKEFHSAVQAAFRKGAAEAAAKAQEQRKR
jgi:hypothetical protein